MWKNTVAYCKVWLGAEELLIKDQRLLNFMFIDRPSLYNLVN